MIVMMTAMVARATVDPAETTEVHRATMVDRPADTVDIRAPLEWAVDMAVRRRTAAATRADMEDTLDPTATAPATVEASPLTASAATMTAAARRHMVETREDMVDVTTLVDMVARLVWAAVRLAIMAETAEWEARAADTEVRTVMVHPVIKAAMAARAVAIAMVDPRATMGARPADTVDRLV